MTVTGFWRLLVTTFRCALGTLCVLLALMHKSTTTTSSSSIIINININININSRSSSNSSITIPRKTKTLESQVQIKSASTSKQGTSAMGNGDTPRWCRRAPAFCRVVRTCFQLVLALLAILDSTAERNRKATGR